MNKRNLLIGLSWAILLLVDIFLVSRLEFGTFVVPHIYFLSILLLPVRTPKSVLLIFGFVTGLAVDLFTNSGGLHAAASTMLAFGRIFMMPLFITAEDKDNNISPGLVQLGFRRFIFYILVLVPLHQITFFALEIFKVDAFLLILKKAGASSLVSILLALIILRIFSRSGNVNERRNR